VSKTKRETALRIGLVFAAAVKLFLFVWCARSKTESPGLADSLLKARQLISLQTSRRLTALV
jgi:hypothetical protein